MTDLWADHRFWGAISGALFVAFLIVLLVAALSPWPKRPQLSRRKGHPEVIGAVRRRCEICDDAWATPATDPYDDLDLCPGCRRALNERRSSDG